LWSGLDGTGDQTTQTPFTVQKYWLVCYVELGVSHFPPGY